MVVKQCEQGGELLLIIGEKFDISCWYELRNYLNVEHSFRKIIFDMTTTCSFDSAGMGILCNLIDQSREMGIAIWVRNPPNYFREFLEFINNGERIHFDSNNGHSSHIYQDHSDLSRQYIPPTASMKVA